MSLTPPAVCDGCPHLLRMGAYPGHLRCRKHPKVFKLRCQVRFELRHGIPDGGAWLPFRCPDQPLVPDTFCYSPHRPEGIVHRVARGRTTCPYVAPHKPCSYPECVWGEPIRYPELEDDDLLQLVAH